MRLLAIILIALAIITDVRAECITLPATSVYDGDTITVAGRLVIVGEESATIDTTVSVRARGYDTPEIRGRCPAEKTLALKARDYVRGLVEQHGVATLCDLKMGKYGRVAADVRIGDDWLATALPALGLARPYDGKSKREGWCDG